MKAMIASAWTMIALSIPAALHATPPIGIVAEPCAGFLPDPSSRPYSDWLLSTDPALSPPPRSSEQMMALDAAQNLRMRYDWADLCHYRAANAALSVPDPQRVVFIGDSITEFWGASDQRLFAGHNINRGIAGQTSAQALARFMADVVGLKPSMVHIWVGTNDIAGNGGPTTLDAIGNNVRAMVAIAKANHIRVILATVAPAKNFGWRPGGDPAPKIAAFNAWLKAFAAQQNCVFVDYFAVLSDGQGGMRSDYSRDGVHPNHAGYAAIRQLAEQAIADARG